MEPAVMPQLPSGTHAGLSIDRINALLEDGNWGAHMAVGLEFREPADLLPIVNIVLFRPWPDGGAGREGLEALGEPYAADFMLNDVGTPKCPWPAEDQEFLLAWLATPRAQEWLQESFAQLQEIRSRVRPKLPEALKGILD
jgi:hypothetical protein